MNSISKNIFSAEKLHRRRAQPFFKQVQPAKPQNLDSIFENSWVQSSREGGAQRYFSRNGDNLTSLANNQVIRAGSIRANASGLDAPGRLTSAVPDGGVQEQLAADAREGAGGQPRLLRAPAAHAAAQAAAVLPAGVDGGGQAEGESGAEEKRVDECLRTWADQGSAARSRRARGGTPRTRWRWCG